MTLNTYVAGNSGETGGLADALRARGDGLDEIASAWHRTRGKAENEWDGAAAEAYISRRAAPNGRDGDALVGLVESLAGTLTRFADGLDTVKARMEQAKQTAREGDLTVSTYAIFPPGAFTAKAPASLEGRVPAVESAAHARATAEFEAAKALHAKQRAAYTEAQSIVGGAREAEKAAHEQLRAGLSANTDAVKQLGESKSWAQAAAEATSPAAVGIMRTVTTLEDRSVTATRAFFEREVSAGPFPTRGMWASLTSAQKADMISRFPEMVGSADGIPVIDRDAANRSILAAQRQALVDRLRKERAKAADIEHRNPGAGGRVDELEESLAGLDKLAAKIGSPGSGYYLLDIDSTAAGRGQAVIAKGNPDEVDHVMTLVPGTYSDLGDVVDYVERNDKVMARANHMAPGETTAVITWSGYEAPPSLFPGAADGSYAEKAGPALSQFQEGLRASHNADSLSHNTLVGHSYGSTVIGYTARDYGVEADDIAFLGSPGVGVAQASELGVGEDHVWSGTAGKDEIDTWTNSTRWQDYVRTLGVVDMHHFGVNPADPGFGANVLPTDPNARHNDYWGRRQSVDGLARLMVDQANGKK